MDITVNSSPGSTSKVPAILFRRSANNPDMILYARNILNYEGNYSLSDYNLIVPYISEHAN